MRIGAISDLHGFLPELPRDLDLLLVAGDLGPATVKYHHNMEYAYDWLNSQFTDWLRKAACDVVGIAGNHDFYAEKSHYDMCILPWTYLEGQVVEKFRLKIWGGPWVPNLPRWAFHKNESDLASTYATIPDDVDILMTHGPMYGFGDVVLSGEHVGSKTLLQRVAQLKNLKLHVFGHIHEDAGPTNYHVRSANVSHVDINYRPKQPIQVFEI